MSDQSAGGAFDPITEALRLLDLFASVGADAFDLTHTNLHQEKRGFRPAQTLAQARASMPYLVPSAARRQNNLIVRPRARAGTVALIQLDDLPPDKLARIAPAAFLVLQTSPQGVQAWIAVQDAPKGFAARLKEGAGADREASGATRVAGTANFKPAYAPDFPTVRIIAAQPGHTVTPETLEALGVVAPEKAQPIPPAVVSRTPAPRTSKWPSYARCLEGAPVGASGHAKRTSADFVWCKIALSWGHSIEDTVARLLLESDKAKENGEAYARQTAEHAEFAARQRNAAGRQPR